MLHYSNRSHRLTSRCNAATKGEHFTCFLLRFRSALLPLGYFHKLCLGRRAPTLLRTGGAAVTSKACQKLPHAQQLLVKTNQNKQTKNCRSGKAETKYRTPFIYQGKKKKKKSRVLLPHKVFLNCGRAQHPSTSSNILDRKLLKHKINFYFTKLVENTEFSYLVILMFKECAFQVKSAILQPNKVNMLTSDVKKNAIHIKHD